MTIQGDSNRPDFGLNDWARRLAVDATCSDVPLSLLARARELLPKVDEKDPSPFKGHLQQGIEKILDRPLRSFLFPSGVVFTEDIHGIVGNFDNSVSILVALKDQHGKWLDHSLWQGVQNWPPGI